MQKTYEELIKIKTYNDIARILRDYPSARNSNKLLLIYYYRDIEGMTLDEAFRSNKVLNYQTIERKGRDLQKCNKDLRGTNKHQKDLMVEECKQTALEIPIVTELF